MRISGRTFLFVVIIFFVCSYIGYSDDFIIPRYKHDVITFFTDTITPLISTYDIVPFEFDTAFGVGGFGLFTGTIFKIPKVDFLRLSVSFTGHRTGDYMESVYETEEPYMDIRMNTYTNVGTIFDAPIGTLGFFAGWYSYKHGIETIVDGVRVDPPAEGSFRFTFVPIINTGKYPYLSFLYQIANFVNSDFKDINQTYYRSDWEFQSFNIGKKVEIMSSSLYTYRDAYTQYAKVYAGGLQFKITYNFTEPEDLSEKIVEKILYDYFIGSGTHSLNFDVMYRHFYDYPDALSFKNGVIGKMTWEFTGNEFKLRLWATISVSSLGVGGGYGAAISFLCLYGEIEPNTFDNSYSVIFGLRFSITKQIWDYLYKNDFSL